MKTKKNRLFIVNVVMFILLGLIVFAMVVYRFLNPTPSLEHRACMDRLNQLAMYETKYSAKNGKYTDKLEKLSRDNSIHFFHKCPLTDEKYKIEITDSSYTIKCERHKIYIKNNILYKE